MSVGERGEEPSAGRLARVSRGRRRALADDGRVLAAGHHRQRRARGVQAAAVAREGIDRLRRRRRAWRAGERWRRPARRPCRPCSASPRSPAGTVSAEYASLAARWSAPSPRATWSFAQGSSRPCRRPPSRPGSPWSAEPREGRLVVGRDVRRRRRRTARRRAKRRARPAAPCARRGPRPCGDAAAHGARVEASARRRSDRVARGRAGAGEGARQVEVLHARRQSLQGRLEVRHEGHEVGVVLVHPLAARIGARRIGQAVAQHRRPPRRARGRSRPTRRGTRTRRTSSGPRARSPPGLWCRPSRPSAATASGVPFSSSQRRHPCVRPRRWCWAGTR